MNAPTALLYARTIRHLRPVQVLGRLWRSVKRPRPDLAPAPPRRRVDRPIEGCRREPALITPTRVRLLGEERSLATAAGWDDPSAAKLWRYHLHYFDDLTARGASTRGNWQAGLIRRWIDENPPGRGTGWEPYPLSLRIVNWIRWALAGEELDARALHSLAVQVRFLRASLEFHLLGNHLLANAKALVCAGLFFEGPEAERWLARGLALWNRQLDEQVLADGGHFERSPMYHARVLEDLLDVLALGRAARVPVGGERLVELGARMRRWLARMSHPDGDIAFFNDAAFGIAPAPAELEAYARRLGLSATSAPTDGVTVLEASGYVRVQLGPQVALLDVGEIGPRYLPGHAHADTLSFELSLADRRVVVNSGTSLYGTGPERRRQRSTDAHNTVVVDGQDSSETWGGFRVARRARPFQLTVHEAADRAVVACSHDGYRRLGRPVVHRRTWSCTPDSIEIADRLTGPPASAFAHLHLHPAVRVEAAGTRLVDAGGATVTVRSDSPPDVQASTWHPRFGSSVASHRLAFDRSAGSGSVNLSW